MVKKTNIESTRALEISGFYPSMTWLKMAVLIGGIGLTYSGLAVAETTDTPASSEPEVPAETSAEHLTPEPSSPHRTSAQVTLSSPSPSTVRPDFTPQRPPASAVATSPSVANSPMFSPVPPPPPAAITVTIPARPATSTTAEDLLKPAVASMAAAATDNAAEAPAAANTPAAVSTEPAPPAATPPTAPSMAETVVPETIAADESVPAGYNSVFIDPTDQYNLGATQAPTAQPGGSPSVVFAERSSGCQITVASGQTSPSAACAPAASGAQASSTGQGEIRVGPIAVSSQGVRLGSTTIVSREALNEKLRPLNVLRRGNEEYVFPLSIPASISSAFGWRMHPIQNTWRFHAGDDLAAPTGTPVIATRAGRVSVSGLLGGYGLTVILRHDDGTLESRYGHLSQLAVRAGEWVEQGEVIGLVGSTGNSTGPHLHFELRQLTDNGWAAVDPSEVLQYGVANLLKIIDNPMLALGQSETEAAADQTVPADLPFRPAQPNAS